MQLPFAAVESCYCLMANQSFVWHWGNSSFSYRQGFVAGRTRQIPHNSVLNVYDGHRASQGGTQLLSLLAENTTILGFKFVCSFFFCGERIYLQIWSVCGVCFYSLLLFLSRSMVLSLLYVSVVWAQAVSSWRAWIFCLVLSRYRWNTDLFFLWAWQKNQFIKTTVSQASFSYKVYQLQQQTPDN